MTFRFVERRDPHVLALLVEANCDAGWSLRGAIVSLWVPHWNDTGIVGGRIIFHATLHHPRDAEELLTLSKALDSEGNQDDAE